MRVVFVTHNELGLACLEELARAGADICAIYTQPEQPEISDQTEFSTFAGRAGADLHHVESVNTPAVKDQMVSYEPDILFVVGWSRLVEPELLDIPALAALGMHPAPLPRGRGRAPLAWSLIKGLDETALSFFHLVEEADAGDLVGQEPIQITIEDDAESLYTKVVEAGRTLIRRYAHDFNSGNVPRTPQDEDAATWWPKRTPKHGLIDWTRSPSELYDWIRGQTRPYPGAFTYIDDTRVTVWSAVPPRNDRAFVPPGEIIYRDEGNLGVGAWEGVLELSEVQVEDDDPRQAADLVTEYNFTVGDKFENARDLCHD